MIMIHDCLFSIYYCDVHDVFYVQICAVCAGSSASEVAHSPSAVDKEGCPELSVS
jgi:hypothetical protein